MRRLPKEQYLALKQFKKKVNSERAGKLLRDHSGHIYEVDENGSLRRKSIPLAEEPISEIPTAHKRIR